MGYYSYKIEHDFGLAPNPFGSYCTLAVCKPDIRRNKKLQLGDWIFGTGSAKLKNLNYFIYGMQVEEKITLEQYWDDPRFQYKKPILNGSLVELYGDNFYHRDAKTNDWIQEDSAHSLDGGVVNEDHLKADTGGEFVLISKTFYYFGDKAFKIPDQFLEICNRGRNVKSNAIPALVADQFIAWLSQNYTLGIHGDPINWTSIHFS
ncbi:hypothetical protein G7092_16735 [Mucilaginibacter sp. HC2]|uniref:Nmad2 family putative nucleotide modification protein n=1 Tax=Mucilaginibacter inviolabilis TaxID=2714892 RepID=UPI001407748C|nr:hypothetical protein [Mucilaginibacter inviolabilis]NHA05459.1 hypothetical protein [Mucilaginibacter inviolabilis]